MFQLLQKDKKWEWTSEHQCAFDALKDKLVSYPILRHPVRNRTFWLHTDASGYALGAVLSQKDPEDDKEYVVAYASRMLKGAELHYGITEKECLAVVYAVKLFRIYLYGAKFNIVTDHSALNWLMSIKDPTGRLARWSIYLQAFNFEISHKKGTLHTNVDTLSRPVVPKILAAEIMNSGINVDEPSSKILDPYDDEGLLHYLRYARHMNGASAKQVRRIENLKDHFSLTKEGLLYRKNVDSMNYLKVPQKEERNDLIIEAHNLGHFQTASTLARLKERYFWKNMETDVEKAVSRCLTCQRHERVPALYHPALAMEVAGCFDEISIDCSWGFPTTKEGFHGVMTIKARMTRFPFAYPLKTKEMGEICERLIEYISLCGPPKTILSDQGTEFCNKLVDSLLKATGVDHLVTSAYNPRTNGMCERFNQTLAEALRKCSEANQDDWHKWIPFVLLAYRSRVHSSTGFSPFELVFGRKMNTFENWKSTASCDEISQLFQRTRELKNLVEVVTPKARENIKKSLERQVKTQNRQNNVVTERLGPGALVFIKAEGILPKLAPRYSGPYKVLKDTTAGNYILENALGEVMEMSYPRHKLKAVADSSENGEVNMEIDEILGQKTVDGKYLYLVKWKNSEATDWVPVDCFNTMEAINEFNRKQAKDSDNKTEEATANQRSSRVLRTRPNKLCDGIRHQVLQRGSHRVGVVAQEQ